MHTYQDANAPIAERVEDLLARMSLEEKVAQLAADVPANERLGIPCMTHGEILHGVLWNPRNADEDPKRYEGARPTIFPQTLAMGCTWDPDLIERVGAAIAREARSLGRHHCYSPNLDVACDCRFGRVEENFGEDPHLVTRLGVAILHGFQGRGAERFDYRHVLATAKHFAGYGLVRGGVNGSEVALGERDLRQFHFPPFEAAVREADVASIMPSHHAMDGVPCHASRWLLEDVLRHEWGFEGFVVSDNIDVWRLHSMQHIAASPAHAAATGLTAGVDQELVLGRVERFFCYTSLPEMVARGLVTEGLIDKSVRRILRAKFELGLFEPDQPEDPREVCDSPAHRELARQVARASHVLLANDGTLPLDPRTVGRVALIGPHGDRCEYGGYVGHIASEGITPLAGLREILGESAELEYRPGCTFGLTGEQPEADVQAEGDVDAMIAEAVAAAGRADTVILALGGTRNTCGEGRDNAEISLPGRQHELARAVLDLGKPTVLVLIGGRPWAIGDIAPRCSAVLLAWYGGCEAGRAIAETLTGRHNPGGRLSMSFPRSEGHCPCTYLHRPLFNGSGSGSYRQHDNTPLYAFGHGLSYTTFGYGEVALSAENIGPAGSVTATVEVTNTGQRSGDEVVQCYVTDEFASVTQPLKQLRGFRRVHLAPGESTSVRFDLDADALAIWDARMERTVEPGWFTVQIGPSSTTGRSARFEVVTPEMPAPTAEQSGATVTRELDMEAPG